MIWIYKGKEWDTVLFKELQSKLDDGWSREKPKPKQKRVRKPKNGDSN